MPSTLKETLNSIDAFKEEAPIFAKRTENGFQPDSEAVVLDLTEEELGLPTNEMAALKCPGLDYFLDVFIAQEMMADFATTSPSISLDERIAAIIHYAECDA
ncbi:MAG: hypothetical protein JWR44_3003 [Hymenobacter sp.]|jgi:hypothetical protein|nr:hypothetical protein [Hymenobacter sp.]